MNEPSNKEYSHLARYDLHRLRELGSEKCVLIHYNFLNDSTESCILLDYDLSGPDASCTIMGPNGRENVSILSLYIKKENVLPMEINWPKPPMNEKVFDELLVSVHEGGRIHRGEQEASRTIRPNLTPSINNPVYWIWWTIGFTGLALAVTVL